MSKTHRDNKRRGERGKVRTERVITVRAVRRDPPDLRKLSRALIALALAEAEAEARSAETTPSFPAVGNTDDVTQNEVQS